MDVKKKLEGLSHPQLGEISTYHSLFRYDAMDLIVFLEGTKNGKSVSYLMNLGDDSATGLTWLTFELPEGTTKEDVIRSANNSFIDLKEHAMKLNNLFLIFYDGADLTVSEISYRDAYTDEWTPPAWG